MRGRGQVSFVLMTGDPRTAGFFRQVVLRERVPFAGTGREPGRADCPVCHGAGVVLDSRGEKAVRYPVWRKEQA